MGKRRTRKDIRQPDDSLDFALKGSYYDDECFVAICRTIELNYDGDRAVDLRRKLDHIADFFVYWNKAELDNSESPPSVMARSFGKMADKLAKLSIGMDDANPAQRDVLFLAANKLEKEAGGSPDFPLDEVTTAEGGHRMYWPHGDERMLRAFDEMKWLSKVFEEAADWASSQKQEKGGASRDQAFEVLLRVLCSHYDEFGTKPRKAHGGFDTDRLPDSPLWDFLSACLMPLGRTMGSEALRAAYRRADADFAHHSDKPLLN